MFVKWQSRVYDFEIMIWNHVSDLGKSNAPLVTSRVDDLNKLNVWRGQSSSSMIYDQSRLDRHTVMSTDSITVKFVKLIV